MGYLDYAGLQYLWGKLKEKFAPKSHNHDDRYYTESEINTLLASKVHEETITNARDLNTIKTTGVYHLRTASYTNGPGVSYHATIFVDYTVGTPYQIFIPDSVNRAWRRNYVNSNDTWSAWTELKFTDTWRGIQDNLTSDSSTDSLSAKQGKELKSLVDGKAANSHTHGLNSLSLAMNVNNATTNSWDMVGGNKDFLLRSLRMQAKAPDWLENNYAAGIAFGGADTKGVISHAYNAPDIKFAGGNGAAPVWWLRLTGTSGKTYDLNAMPYASSAGVTNKLSPFIKTIGEVKNSNSWFRVARFDLTTINTKWNNIENMWANWTQLRASFLIEGRYAKSGIVNVLAETTGNINVAGQANPKEYYAKNRISIKLNCYGVDSSYIEARAAISNDNHIYVDFWVRNGEYNTTSVYCLGRNNDSNISLIANFSISSSVTSPDYTYYDCIYLKTSYGDSIVTKDILPVSNNAGSIGTSNNKWNTVFATTFNGKATSAGTADVANSVDWSKVQNKPSSYTPASHTHDDRYYTEGEINSKLDGKSNTGHTHDDRYYTETEINAKLNGKANSSHTHTKSQITDFPASLKNPTALTIQTNGTTAATYDGSAAKTVNITKGNIGLGNVDNTADANKSVKYATSAGNASKVNNHTVNIDVPADAKFTDTNTWRGIQNNLISDSTDQSLSAAQGKALKTLVDGKAPTSHTHTKSQITDFPTSMPASDVYAWAKAATKPSYTKAEVGLSNVDNTADKDKSVKYAETAGTAEKAVAADNGIAAFNVNNTSTMPTGYIRFNNGIQICWGKTYSGNTSGSFTYPQSFSGLPSVMISGTGAYRYAFYVTKFTKTGFEYYRDGSGDTAKPQYIAIGSWEQS